ncbi:apical junction molecule-like [Lineus longissimus]|uniref:apical junction molecule-like n=1 Tax=Lineus longissimus TaxID=88925 RepID=UPI002B4E83B1
MGELLAERKQVTQQIFHDYDTGFQNELTPEQLHILHADFRMGGISLPQVRAAMKYSCASEHYCDVHELFDLLQEMDRRYFLIQDFRWEFSMLDREMKDTITEEEARWMMQAVHSELFSKKKWQKFLMQRAAPGSGVTFAEIEVDLCDIPSREALAQEQYEDEREREERERRRKERVKLESEEKMKYDMRRDEERKKKAHDDKKKKKAEDQRRKLADEDMLKKAKEKEDEERRKKEMELEEERGRRESELREKIAKEEAERKVKEDEERRRKEEEDIAEMKRLQDLAEKVKREQELERERDREAAMDAAVKAKEEADLEREAEDDVRKAQMLIKQARDPKERKNAEDREGSAKLRSKEHNHKKIRFNLKVAIKERTKDKLVPAVSDFKKVKLPDDEGDLEKAERILKEIRARDDLNTSCIKRKLNDLEKAINYVKNNGFDIQLATEMVEANKLLIQLKRLERIRAEILDLKQSTVAEIRSYQKPPAAVHTVMTATFLLLGHKEKEMKDWKAVQALVGKTGKESLKRRCLGLDAAKLDLTAAKRAKILLSQFKLDEVRDVSAGAATFYVWGTSMIEEAEANAMAKK